jgi:hypothetical protein
MLTPYKTIGQQDLTVAYQNSDCGSYTTGNTFDEFALMQGDDRIAVLRIEYGDEATPVTTKLSQVDCVPAGSLPHITSALHLSAAMVDTVMQAFTADHEFYNEVFQDEDGHYTKRLPLLIAV